MHTVKIARTRPDFRCFVDLLYGHDRNVDTEGDSYPVNSRLWTCLYINDRESDLPYVEISPTENDPAIFSVTSASPEQEELTAIYLFLTCGDSISCGGELLVASAIEELRKKYARELLRAEQSIWHQSSDECRYPNQRREG